MDFQEDFEARVEAWATEIVAASIASEDAEDALARRIVEEVGELLDGRIALARIVAGYAVADAFGREQAQALPG